MTSNLFEGQLVRLAVDEPEKVAEALSGWGRNSEYIRLLDNDPVTLRSVKRIKEWFDPEKTTREDIFFTIRTLDGDKLIGFTAMFDLSWNQGNCLVAIGLGEPDYWGKGYGTEAMRLMLRYGFDELNLHRVSLWVFAYNTRAIESYKKAGFVVEGRQRGALLREGVRSDIIMMGILREEWMKRQG